MCNYWKFNEYCPAPNSTNVNTLASIEPKDSRTIQQKLNRNNYYKDDYVYLFTAIQINQIMSVRI